MFESISRFNIDNGELDGLSSQQCFVLGYELAQIDSLLSSGEKIYRPVNADNRERIESACRRANRQYRLTWLSDDASEGWMQLEVDAA